MHLTILTNLALLVASAVAQSSSANPFNIPNGGYALIAGKASTITWKPTTSGSVTLTLREGANSNLNKGTVIARTSACLTTRSLQFMVLIRLDTRIHRQLRLLHVHSAYRYRAQLRLRH